MSDADVALFDHPDEEPLPPREVYLDISVKVDLAKMIKGYADQLAEVRPPETPMERLGMLLYDAMNLADGAAHGAIDWRYDHATFRRLWVEALEAAQEVRYPLRRVGD